ncbi:hypothetical protein CY35_07G052800 [Sphagnum magellanicum]|uniref:Uncharacterized protein n=1 Tax=Sphagnum magellanicum TaxID=128215 RepID=A0ACB8HL92_9BRYO|nr:hypothetical protein CY35_07G052800 [Sphagnum magellanicum]
MEIFRKMEGLSEEIETKQPPLEHWRRFVYCTTLAGRVLGTVDHLQPEGRSPTSVAHFSQHHLLPLLFERAQRLRRRLEPKASTVKIASSVLNVGPILMGHECTSIKSSSNGVLASIFPTQGVRLGLVRVKNLHVSTWWQQMELEVL